MHNRYPPDADATDVFPVTDTDIDTILELFDEGPDGYERAIEHAEELGLDESQFEDLMEWFGRY
jgi:hypothetical protein